MIKREQIQKEWEDLVKIGITSYQKLNCNQKVWFLIEPIINSGLIDHYINEDAKHNDDLIFALKKLEMFEITNLFLEVNSLFKNQRPPKSIDLRNEEIYNWDNSKKNVLENNEELFWKNVSSLEEKLILFINKNII